MHHRVWLTTYAQHIHESWLITTQFNLPDDGHRAKAVRYLEEMLVANDACFFNFMKSMFRLWGYCPTVAVHDEWLNTTLKYGLSALRDSDLAELICNPLALMRLAMEIESYQPSYWLEVMEKESLHQQKKHGAPKCIQTQGV